MTPAPDDPRTGSQRALAHWAPVALLLVPLVVVLAASGTPVGWIGYLTGCVGGAAVAWTGALRRALRRGVPWVSVTLTLNAVAALLDAGFRVAGWAPDVTPADAFRVAAYASLATMLLRQQVGGRRRPGTTLHAVLDGTAALSVTLLVMYQTGVWAALADEGHDALARITWIGYPTLDAVLMGLVAWRVVLHGRVRHAALLGLAGVACWLVADLGRLVPGDGPSEVVVCGASLVGVLLLAAVPWVRSTPADRALVMRRPGHGPWRIALNVAPFVVPAVLEVVGHARGVVVDPVPDVAVWSVLVVLNTVRTRLLAVDGERAWDAVRSQARRSEALAANTSDAVAVVAKDGRLTTDSPSLARLLGTRAKAGDDLPGLLSAVGVVPVAVHTVLDRTRRRPGDPVELELEGRTSDGRPQWLGGRAVDLSADPDVDGIVVSIYDITRRKLAEQELAHQAFHDGLTGLANRSLFLDRSEQALRRAGRSGAAPIVLFLDLDGFKDVNDSMGHYAGDALLQAVAQRLRGVVRAADTVARLGGDEFAVLVDDPAANGMDDAAELAERLLAVLSEPVRLEDSSVTVGASIGVVRAEPESTPLTLLQDGDIAMYRAKAAGRGQWVAFDPPMRAEAIERIELERQLATALDDGQLRLVYQPVVELSSDRVVGFEALLRWQHPTLGPVGPDRFVPVAEASGLIVPIGRWVLTEATRTMARWQQDRPGTPLSIAVNVSPRQLAGGSFLDDVATALADSGIEPSSLTLEITETALVIDPEAVAERLAQLRAMGVRIALDDFGTGYSSLSYLRQFPVDVLKIDRSFVRLLSASGEDAAIVHGIVQLGRTLDLEVVAEGVEDVEQRDRLRDERCHLAQGYLFSRPLEVDDAERALTPATVAQPTV